MKFNFSKIQALGRALMLPIALLPVAGILLRLGQPDLLNIVYIAKAGQAVFDNLPILFAVGIAVGLAKENNGTAALAGVVGYLIMTTIMTAMNKSINTGVLGGIIIGVIAAILYNRYRDIKLPEYLAFFGGKRFVPIATGLSAVILGLILGYIWPPIQNGINIFGSWLIHSGDIGLFIYGVMNRILIITGLHHIINNLVWFVFGSYTGANGVVSHGDITRFMAGDPTAGVFTAGMFPIMMFGLPAACLAMYKNAFTENKKAVAGLLFSMALTSFLTGVTEPIEFSFVFLAPFLFALHAILTGLSAVVMHMLNIHIGFTFSAGAIDYILFYKMSTHPILLIPVGIATFVIYFVVFDFAIRKYNLATIGREVMNTGDVNIAKADSRALQFIEALGGAANLVSVDACTTRLRLVVENQDLVNRDALKMLGARGVLAPSQESLQVILGPTADLIASEIRDAIAAMKITHVKDSKKTASNLGQDILKIVPVSADVVEQAKDIVRGLGGIENIKSINLVALTRLRVEIANDALIEQQTFATMKNVKFVPISSSVKQLYAGDDAENLYWGIESIFNK